MNFKRHEVQEYLESQVGCFDICNWTSYKPRLINWEVSPDNIHPLERCMDSDLNSYFYKAFESFCQAIFDIHNKKYSWSIVKLYYATFYLLRCDILLAKYLLIRCGGMYYTKIEEGNKLKLFKRANIRGDHQLTIAFSKMLFDSNEIIDPLFGNEIDGLSVYTWLMKNRERINYQQNNFPEPYPDEYISHLMMYFSENSIKNLFTFYNSNSDYSICFDTDHSILAIPYKKLIQIFKKSNGKINLQYIYKKKVISNINLLEKYSLGKEALFELIS